MFKKFKKKKLNAGQNLFPEHVVYVTEVIADYPGFTKILRSRWRAPGTRFSVTHTHTHTSHRLQGECSEEPPLLLSPAFANGFQTCFPKPRVSGVWGPSQRRTQKTKSGLNLTPSVSLSSHPGKTEFLAPLPTSGRTGLTSAVILAPWLTGALTQAPLTPSLHPQVMTPFVFSVAL